MTGLEWWVGAAMVVLVMAALRVPDERTKAIMWLLVIMTVWTVVLGGMFMTGLVEFTFT